MKVLFIIGAPRSGTNMLRDCLSSMSMITTWPCDELNYMWRLSEAHREDDELDAGKLTEEDAQRIRKIFRERRDCYAHKQGLGEREAKEIVVLEKTCANCLRIGVLEKVFPDARYIYLKRDGIDAIVSASERIRGKVRLGYILQKVRFIPRKVLIVSLIRMCSRLVRKVVSPINEDRQWGPRIAQQYLGDEGLDEIGAAAAQWLRCTSKAEEDLSLVDKNRVWAVKYEELVSKKEELLYDGLRKLNVLVDRKLLGEACAGFRVDSIGSGKRKVGRDVLVRIEGVLGKIG